MNIVTWIICSAIACGVAAVAFVFLGVTGAVNARAEEEYWSEFWLDTPSTAVRGEFAEVTQTDHREIYEKAA